LAKQRKKVARRGEIPAAASCSEKPKAKARRPALSGAHPDAASLSEKKQRHRAKKNNAFTTKT
jgi:hypothetical protein